MSIKTLITGGTGLTGTLFLRKLAALHPNTEVLCLVRPTSDLTEIDALPLNLTHHIGDSASDRTWDEILVDRTLDTIVHIAQLRQIPIILDCLKKVGQTPRLIVIGTTGVYSKYNEYSAEYKEAENYLSKYSGSYCLLRPTMIYGSPRDKNLHKLIKFCHRYGLFPIFGSGKQLLQPVHTEDIAQALLNAWKRPEVRGAYDLSGASIVNFGELLALVEKTINKPIRQINLPLNLGLWLATLLESTLGKKSPVRREQILRLQEDKAYPHDAAQKDLDFLPRTLEVGLQEEVELMRSKDMI